MKTQSMYICNFIDKIYHMNFQQLEYLLAVHREKHFARAADACHVTQATLSAMIKKLEDELDMKLFDRSRVPVQTTDYGLQVIEKARLILKEKNELLELKNKDFNDIIGTIRLGIIPTVASALLPIILPKITQQYPKIHLVITEITTDEIIHQLEEDKLDMGILATPLELEHIEEEILYYESMMIYGIEQKNKTYITPEDLSDKNIWLLEEGNCFRDQSITLCNIQEKKDQNQAIEFKGNSFETLLNMSDYMGGFTLLPELHYTQLSDQRKKQCSSFESPTPVREISIVSQRLYSKKNSINLLAKLIQDIVQPQLSTFEKAPKELRVIGI